MGKIQTKLIKLEQAKGRKEVTEMLGVSKRHYLRILDGWIPATKKWPLGNLIELLHKIHS